ncbi:MAG: hypothetical protein QOH93_2348 [Chloroflexia bacterium]|jgi:hypothetical protein|nr:hypothetical protein [Chloroflexia bacterium]
MTALGGHNLLVDPLKSTLIHTLAGIPLQEGYPAYYTTIYSIAKRSVDGLTSPNRRPGLTAVQNEFRINLEVVDAALL